MSMADRLRLRVRHDVTPNRTRVEVLAADGTVLGDLATSVADIKWVKTPGDPMSILTLEVAVERCAIDSIEVPDYNAPARDA